MGDALPCITYFDIRGRAEPVRLVYEDLGEPYEDRRVTDIEWIDLKPRTPFGQLPLFSQGDLHLTQSYAIYRHLARSHVLYGASELDRVQL